MAKLVKWFFILFVVLAPVVAMAQTGFEDDVLDNPVPFDGGVSLLIAAGVGYGLKKAHNKRKNLHEAPTKK